MREQRPNGSWPYVASDTPIVLTLKVARATIADMMADPVIAAQVNRDDMKKNVRQALQALDGEIRIFSRPTKGTVTG